MFERNNYNDVNNDPMDEADEAGMEGLSFQRLFEAVMKSLGGDPSEDIELDCIEIDGCEYAILKQIELSGTPYLFLANTEDPEDIMFHKIIEEDGEEYIVPLDSQEEFEQVLPRILQSLLALLDEEPEDDGEDV